jgi:hypothetical protein
VERARHSATRRRHPGTIKFSTKNLLSSYPASGDRAWPRGLARRVWRTAPRRQNRRGLAVSLAPAARLKLFRNFTRPPVYCKHSHAEQPSAAGVSIYISDRF